MDSLELNFRVGGLWQWGGYDQGNGTDGMYQGQVGGDFNLFGGTPWAGTLSMDAIGSWAKDAVNLSTFTGTCATFTKGPFAGQTGCTSGLPKFYTNTDLKATLSNNTGFLFTAKYKWQALTVYGGYAWLKQADPSDDLSERLPDHRRLERSRDHPLDLPRRQEILADAMDQLHDLRHSEDRSLFLGRRQICDHPAARRDRRLLLPRPDRLQHHSLRRRPHHHCRTKRE